MSERTKVGRCPTCRGPVTEHSGDAEESYLIPIAEGTLREDFENEMLRTRLQGAERIIVDLRSKLKGLS